MTKEGFKASKQESLVLNVVYCVTCLFINEVTANVDSGLSRVMICWVKTSEREGQKRFV